MFFENSSREAELSSLSVLPNPFPASFPKGHGRELALPILFNAALLPFSALCVYLPLPTNQISGRRVDKFGLLKNLPAHEENEGIGHGEVACDEALYFEWLKRVETDEDNSRDSHAEGYRSSVWVERGDIMQLRVGEVLCLLGTVPSQERHKHQAVCEDQGRGGEIDEPKEDFDGCVGSAQEGD